MHQTDKFEDLYGHMVKKFIYETVLKSYWVPITILTILVTFIMIAAVTLFLHIIAIMPIKEMS